MQDAGPNQPTPPEVQNPNVLDLSSAPVQRPEVDVALEPAATEAETTVTPAPAPEVAVADAAPAEPDSPLVEAEDEVEHALPAGNDSNEPVVSDATDWVAKPNVVPAPGQVRPAEIVPQHPAFTEGSLPNEASSQDDLSMSQPDRESLMIEFTEMQERLQEMQERRADLTKRVRDSLLEMEDLDKAEALLLQRVDEMQTWMKAIMKADAEATSEPQETESEVVEDPQGLTDNKSAQIIHRGQGIPTPSPDDAARLAEIAANFKLQQAAADTVAKQSAAQQASAQPGPAPEGLIDSVPEEHKPTPPVTAPTPNNEVINEVPAPTPTAPGVRPVDATEATPGGEA